MKLSAKLAKGKYDHNKDNETHLLVELEAPKVEWDKDRSPICIVPILDVSGSMAGDKLDYLQKACRKLIDHLSPGDLMGMVAFDSMVYEVSPIREITQTHKDEMKKKVAQLRAGSCTNLSGGLQQGLKWIKEAKLNKDIVLRVVIFTDGHANVGISNRALIDFTKEHMGSATISAFGFGNDCDQELLADIANVGGGNYAFIDSPDAALTAFARELGGLMSTYGQELKITISPDKNNEVLEILNDEDVSENEGVTTINIRDILGEEKKWVVAKIKLHEVEKALPRKVNAFKIGVSFKNKDGDVESLDNIAVRVKFCKPGEEPTEEDKDVVEQRDRLLAGRAQDRAEECARNGNFVQARAIMDDCCESIASYNIKGLVGDMAANYSNSVLYNDTRGVSNSVRSSLKMKRVAYTSSGGGAFCSSAGAQSYSAMDDLVEKFKAEDGDKIIVDSTGNDSSSLTISNENTAEPTTTTPTTKNRSGSDW